MGIIMITFSIIFALYPSFAFDAIRMNTFRTQCHNTSSERAWGIKTMEARNQIVCASQCQLLDECAAVEYDTKSHNCTLLSDRNRDCDGYTGSTNYLKKVY